MTKPKEKALNRAARKWGCALYRYTEPDASIPVVRSASTSPASINP